jgi:hypothetical protein
LNVRDDRDRMDLTGRDIEAILDERVPKHLFGRLDCTSHGSDGVAGGLGSLLSGR